MEHSGAAEFAVQALGRHVKVLPWIREPVGKGAHPIVALRLKHATKCPVQVWVRNGGRMGYERAKRGTMLS